MTDSKAVKFCPFCGSTSLKKRSWDRYVCQGCRVTFSKPTHRQMRKAPTVSK